MPVLRTQNQDQNGRGYHVGEGGVECPESFDASGTTAAVVKGEIGGGELS